MKLNRIKVPGNDDETNYVIKQIFIVDLFFNLTNYVSE